MRKTISLVCKLTPSQAAAINCQIGQCVMLGDVSQRMVVSPDIWQLMSSEEGGSPTGNTGNNVVGVAAHHAGRPIPVVVPYIDLHCFYFNMPM